MDVIRKFREKEDGSIAITSAVVIAAGLGLVFLSMDYSMYAAKKNKADSMAEHAHREMRRVFHLTSSSDKAIEAGESFFFANVKTPSDYSVDASIQKVGEDVSSAFNVALNPSSSLSSQILALRGSSQEGASGQTEGVNETRRGAFKGKANLAKTGSLTRNGQACRYFKQKVYEMMSPQFYHVSSPMKTFKRLLIKQVKNERGALLLYQKVFINLTEYV